MSTLKLDPTCTTLVTMECQRGVIGDLATFPMLKEAVGDVDLLQGLGVVSKAARTSGCSIVHALAHFREDRAGSPTNAPLLRAAAKIPCQLIEGSESAQLVPELDGHAGDDRSYRYHGVSPFGGTDLDDKLRAANTTHVVAVGASLNVGLMGLCIEAVNLGYEVLLVTDAVVAVPASLAKTLISASFAQIATLITTDEFAVSVGYQAT